MEYFQHLELNDWRQFRRVNLNLSNPLVILTGPNGCGKTTILNVLGRHFGWNINFVSTPYLSERKSKRFWSDVFEQRHLELEHDSQTVNVGKIKYESQAECTLQVPSTTESHQYSLSYSNQHGVEGIHIPSHRPVTSYVSIDNIPVNPKTNQQHFQEFQQLLFQTYGSTNSRNPGLILKQSLVALALFGYGNEHVRPNIEYRNLFEGFQAVLREILPKNLGFKRLEVRMPDIVLETETGTFSLDAMSGGVSAIFGMAWQIHMYGAYKSGCTVIIDEPENHLHPSMQREFLPALIRAFPGYRFIVSTHSPFIAASAPDAHVYALSFAQGGKVESVLLEGADLAASPNKILRDILDVPTTLPIWVEDRLREVLSKHKNVGDTQQSIDELYTELKKLGLSSAIGEWQNRERS